MKIIIVESDGDLTTEKDFRRITIELPTGKLIIRPVEGKEDVVRITAKVKGAAGESLPCLQACTPNQAETHRVEISIPEPSVPETDTP